MIMCLLMGGVGIQTCYGKHHPFGHLRHWAHKTQKAFDSLVDHTRHITHTIKHGAKKTTKDVHKGTTSALHHIKHEFKHGNPELLVVGPGGYITVKALRAAGFSKPANYIEHLEHQVAKKVVLFRGKAKKHAHSVENNPRLMQSALQKDYLDVLIPSAAYYVSMVYCQNDPMVRDSIQQQVDKAYKKYGYGGIRGEARGLRYGRSTDQGKKNNPQVAKIKHFFSLLAKDANNLVVDEKALTINMLRKGEHGFKMHSIFPNYDAKRLAVLLELLKDKTHSIHRGPICRFAHVHKNDEG
ncbi:hypothetical protein [Candidatus Hepatobacter penaei]|uniref:hypothetical protein n=1 Tax=Candidatus Hepatobacter penaei TaxID=1274402 RepID=UPI0012E09629|nr:hypothetical protein [Candidatus Hepatobacter penaei]